MRKWIGISFAMLGASLLLPFGCTDKKEETPAAPPASPTAATKYTEPAPTMPATPTTPPAMANGNATTGVTPTPAAPFANGGGSNMTAEEALKQAPTLDPKFAPMQKDLAERETALKKAPDDPKAKAAYVETAYKYGHELYSGDTSVSQTIRYRAALAVYRRVLKVDPANQKSLEEKQMIEKIYSSMGRPIPQ